MLCMDVCYRHIVMLKNRVNQTHETYGGVLVYCKTHIELDNTYMCI